MGGGEGGKFGSGGEEPGMICKSAPPYGQCRIDNIAPTGVAFCSEYNPQCWGPL